MIRLDDIQQAWMVMITTLAIVAFLILLSSCTVWTATANIGPLTIKNITTIEYDTLVPPTGTSYDSDNVEDE